MEKKEMIRRNRACREKVEALIRKNKKQREEIVKAYGENLEMQEQLEALMRMIEEQRVKITATKPEGPIRIYTQGQQGLTDVQALELALLVGCVVTMVVLTLVSGVN